MLTFTDDVRGHVIGQFVTVADLFYEGRKQGRTIYAPTEDGAIQAGQALKADIIASCGEGARHIFPLDAWEIRIYD